MQTANVQSRGLSSAPRHDDAGMGGLVVQVEVGRQGQLMQAHGQRRLVLGIGARKRMPVALNNTPFFTLQEIAIWRGFFQKPDAKITHSSCPF